MNIGKAYTNRKPVSERPESDFYPTPKYLVERLLIHDAFVENLQTSYEYARLHNRCEINVLEPACGNGAISSVLKKRLKFANIIEHDIRTDGVDFLSYEPKEKIDLIITNPPFSLFDDFVQKAKKIAPVVVFIGKLNFFGAYNRHMNDVWHDLRNVLIFNRQVDYRTEERDDGKFYCGNLVTGWFIWNVRYQKEYFMTDVIDVQSGVIKRGQK